MLTREQDTLVKCRKERHEWGAGLVWKKGFKILVPLVLAFCGSEVNLAGRRTM